MRIRTWHGVVAGLALTGGAHAQASTIISYCNSQYPDNSSGLVAPANARNCSAYITNNLSTVPYTGQVSTVYPLVAYGANISGTVSATRFVGNGAGLTGIGGTSPTWYGITNIPTQVANISNSGIISVSGISVNSITATALMNVANISATGNISVTTINGATPVFSGAPSWYVVTNIPTQIQSVSSSGNITLTNLTMTATITGTTIISTSNGGIISGTNIYAKAISTSTLTVGSCTGCGSNGLSAWVRFNGASCQTNSATCIVKQNNIKSVSGTATGAFVITFNTPLTDALYGLTGSTALSGGNGATVSQCGPNPTSSTFTICTKGSATADADISASSIFVQD